MSASRLFDRQARTAAQARLRGEDAARARFGSRPQLGDQPQLQQGQAAVQVRAGWPACLHMTLLCAGSACRAWMYTSFKELHFCAKSCTLTGYHRSKPTPVSPPLRETAVPPVGAQARCQPVTVEQAECQRTKAGQGARLHKQAETTFRSPSSRHCD